MNSAAAGDSRYFPRGRFSRLVLGVLMTAALSASCLPEPVPTQPARDDLSEVQVFLQPVPPEARRVSWKISDVSAIAQDGTRVPLTVYNNFFRGSDLEGRQTRLASGFVRPGSFNGITLTVSSASLKGEDGEAALLVQEAPLVIEMPFELALSEVMPLFLTMDTAGIVDSGFAFSPDFSMKLPHRELASLTGYLTIQDRDQITIFNRKTLQVVGAVATGRKPGALAIDPDRDRAYVAVEVDNAIEIVDFFGGSVHEKIILRSGDEPVDLALSGDGRILVSANYASGTVSLIDPLLAVETDRMEVGRGPTSVTVNESGTRAYVTCSLSGTVSVVDLSTGTLSAAISIEETTPLAAALDGREEKLFVIGENSPNLTVIDMSALTVESTIYVGTGSVSIAVDKLSGLAFVGRKSSSEISVVDPSVQLPVDYFGLKSPPGQMVVDLQEKALMVILPERRALQKVDLVSRKIMAEMELDGVPGEVAVIE